MAFNQWSITSFYLNILKKNHTQLHKLKHKPLLKIGGDGGGFLGSVQLSLNFTRNRLLPLRNDLIKITPREILIWWALYQKVGILDTNIVEQGLMVYFNLNATLALRFQEVLAAQGLQKRVIQAKLLSDQEPRSVNFFWEELLIAPQEGALPPGKDPLTE